MVTVPDQALMAEAADLIQELRAKVASLEASVLEERAARYEAEKISDSFIEQAAEGSARQEDEIAKLEDRVEWLEEDRKRLSALIHPDTPGCDVVAGRCYLCDEAIKGQGRVVDTLRKAHDTLEEKLEQRNADVRELCGAAQSLLDECVTGDVLPYESEVRKALLKVRKGME